MRFPLIGEVANPLAVDNPLYREILARAHAAIIKSIEGKPTVASYEQQEVDLCDRIFASTQRLELELRLHDILLAEYEHTLAAVADLKGAQGKSSAT